jgi:hypothetical protein
MGRRALPPPPGGWEKTNRRMRTQGLAKARHGDHTSGWISKRWASGRIYPVGQQISSGRSLVCRRLLDVIDDDEFTLPLGEFQFETDLFLQGIRKRR